MTALTWEKGDSETLNVEVVPGLYYAADSTATIEALKRPGTAEPAKAGDAVVAQKQEGAQGFCRRAAQWSAPTGSRGERRADRGGVGAVYDTSEGCISPSLFGLQRSRIGARCLTLRANFSGEQLVYKSLGCDLGIDEKTVKKWIKTLRYLYFGFEVRPRAHVLESACLNVEQGMCNSPLG